jgi:hypothetical protein
MQKSIVGGGEVELFMVSYVQKRVMKVLKNFKMNNCVFKVEIRSVGR